jgi:hypothetical protein
LIADDNGDPRHEPCALPGWYIFVPARLILDARNEAEVALMLARSMAHRFPVASGQYGTIPLIFVGGGCSASKRLLIPRSLQAQQEVVERDADRDAMSAVVAAGYDPTHNEPPSAAFLAIQRVLR